MMEENNSSAKPVSAARKVIAFICFILSSAILSFQAFIFICTSAYGSYGTLDWYYKTPLRVLGISYLPLLLLIGGSVAFLLREKAAVYKKKRSNVMFVVAIASFFLPSFILNIVKVSTVGQVSQIIHLVFSVITYFCLVGGISMRFLPKYWRTPWILMFCVFPMCIFISCLIVFPDFALALLITIIMLGLTAWWGGLSKLQRGMIKGAIAGRIIGGDAGAVVGALIARENNKYN